eukprot:1574632-Pyramimonas_sp.AAC.1
MVQQAKETSVSALNQELKSQVESGRKSSSHVAELEAQLASVRNRNTDLERVGKELEEFQRTLQNNLERQGTAARKRIAELSQQVKVQSQSPASASFPSKNPDGAAEGRQRDLQIELDSKDQIVNSLQLKLHCIEEQPRVVELK